MLCHYHRPLRILLYNVKKNCKICKAGYPLTVWCDIACFSQALSCRVCKTVLECRRLVLVTSRSLLRPHGIFQALFLASFFFNFLGPLVLIWTVCLNKSDTDFSCGQANQVPRRGAGGIFNPKIYDADRAF